MNNQVIRRIRLLNDMSQDDVAAMFGISRASVQQLENGKLKLSNRLRLKYVEMLGATPENIEFVQQFIDNQQRSRWQVS